MTALFPFAGMAQASIVSGMQGSLYDSINKTSVGYTVTLSGAATTASWGEGPYCGISWPSIECPTMGNVASEGIVTYTFSSPVTSIDLVLCHVNMNGSIAPETFTVTVNHGQALMNVAPNSCAAWTVQGSVLTSPSTEGGMHSVVHITSDSAFTTLTIRSANNDQNGGSGTGFVENSARVRAASTPFTVQPAVDTRKKMPHKKSGS